MTSLGNPDQGRLLTPIARQKLFDLAESALEYAVINRGPILVKLSDYERELREERASFVTLKDKEGELRGCVGSLWPNRPLVADVAYNAYAASNEDTRFLPVELAELPLQIHISVLSVPKLVKSHSEAFLLSQLQVGVHGLIISDGKHSATFLPAVWEQIPDPEEFLQALKNKAGFPANYWPSSIVAYSYTVESIGAEG